MRKKILAIGLSCNREKKIITGQGMMFDATVEKMIEKGFTVIVVNLTTKYLDIKVGKIELKRIVEYFSIILRTIPKFYKARNGILYITTAQSKGGFFRDFVFIHLAILFGYKILIQQFGSNFEVFYNGLSPFLKLLVRTTFNKGQFIIVEGEFSKNQFSIIKNYENKVIPITNGLPEKELKTSSRGKIINNEKPFSLLYLNNMIESKGYWDILKAMDILINKYNKNVKCVFVGVFMDSVDDVKFKNSSDAKQAFNNFIDKNNLSEFISYYNGLIGLEKANVFVESNVFLLPSYYKFEGQPVAVLEALAYGSVPIVTNYRMIPDMVTNECGCFVDKKSPDHIVEKILFLIDNPDIYRKLSQCAIDRYQEFFTLEKYCNKIFNLIELLY